MLPTEHNRTQELGPFPAPLCARLLPSNEQFTRVARPQHLSPDQDRRQHDGVRPVHGQRFNPAKTGQWTPVLCRKCHVVAKVRDCSTRLDPAHHISPRKVLVLDRDHGLHKDSRPSQLRPVTVGTLIDRFIAEYAPKRCRKPTQRVYHSLFENHIRPRWGTEFVQNIKTGCVEKWLEEYPHSRQIKSHVRNLMHTLYEAAIRWELVERNPVSLVRQSRKRLKTPRVLTPPEFKSLLLELDEPYKTMVVTIACLGLRVCELMALQWGDIDLKVSL
ncbi:MAG: hypothetical protein KGM47_07375 [Acidobacteriota bacterium]|nr:hypothetical protein [Acidobacteriota bacterium]